MTQASFAHEQECSAPIDLPKLPMLHGEAGALREVHLPPAYERGVRENITLELDSVDLLCELCQKHAVAPIFRSHRASLSAAEKQRIVAPAVVQKTITLRIGGMMVLCSAVGDPILRKADTRRIGERLGLSRSAAKKISINPQDCDPLISFGMPHGMVSPFLLPGRRTLLDGVAVLVAANPPMGTADEGAASLVAISLSLNWSLLVEAGCFHHILREYAARAYSWLPFIDLTGRD